MENLVEKLRRDYPSLKFKKGYRAHWSPQESSVIYSTTGKTAAWTLFHELGHALCNHQNYSNDIDLLKKETEAWQKAHEVAKEYRSLIPSEHIEACLDTYRDWLYKRSQCPECYSHGFQYSKALYYCPNCQTHWEVSSARFCRPYRLKKALRTN